MLSDFMQRLILIELIILSIMFIVGFVIGIKRLNKAEKNISQLMKEVIHKDPSRRFKSEFIKKHLS